VLDKQSGQAANAEIKKPAVLTGNGHINFGQLNLAKELLRAKHPGGAKLAEIARHAGCTADRAERLMDLLSEESDFLVYMDDDFKPPRYFMYEKDGPENGLSGNRMRNAGHGTDRRND